MEVSQLSFEVSEKTNAKSVQSGTLDVLASPYLIARMEETAYKLVEPLLKDKQTTVGTEFIFNHLNSSKIGETILIECHLDEKSNKKFIFLIEAKSNDKVVATGKHTRYIVNEDEFMNK